MQYLSCSDFPPFSWYIYINLLHSSCYLLYWTKDLFFKNHTKTFVLLDFWGYFTLFLTWFSGATFFWISVYLLGGWNRLNIFWFFIRTRLSLFTYSMLHVISSVSSSKMALLPVQSKSHIIMLWSLWIPRVPLRFCALLHVGIIWRFFPYTVYSDAVFWWLMSQPSHFPFFLLFLCHSF